ncbi:AMP-dependent synthetase/ligase [Kineococcus gynurae]|uniref:Acyl-CoA synthetase n=1 Tax=Kineococcus gynurae TaxID=452979 RepID=A0ABV5LUG7_9ACTN
MRTISEAPLVPPIDQGNITDCVTAAASEEPRRPVVARKQADGSWADVSAAAFLEEVRALAKGLLAAGLRPGDRVGIMSRTRYEWTLVDVAVWFAGGVGVPVYETSSPEQVRWILSDSGAVACFVETTANAACVAEVRADLAALRDVWTIDSGAVAELTTAGRDVDDAELEQARRSASPQDTATIIYTSGTTGRPKGCVLTHANFVDLSRNATEAIPEVLRGEGAATLLFLPLAHVFARFIQVLCLSARVKIGHTSDPKDLIADLGGYRPTFILAVPRVFQKVYNGAEQKAAAAGSAKAKIFAAASATAIAWSRAEEQGKVGVGLRARHALFDRLVYSKLRALLGGRVQYAVSGGAPMGERLAHFFRGVGVTVLEGYGLTETTAPLSVGRPGRLKVGTVGPPLPGTTLAIADDGEILAKGVGVFSAYLHRPEATAEAITDGWFHTGDLGDVDVQGFVRITGRKKDIIVTANGKNVAPAELEDRIRAHPLVSQVVVVGDARHFIGALVTLDPEALPSWGNLHGKPDLTLERALHDPDVEAAVQAAVDTANRSVSRAESIRKFRFLPDDFTIENGYLTPSQKVKRAEVLRDFAGEVDALYT